MAEENIKSGLLAAVALLAEQGNSTTLEKFAVAVIAETIFFNEWSSVVKGATIDAYTEVEISLKKIAKLIQSKCEGQRQYKTLKEYNRESLYLLIEKEWGKFEYEQCLIPLKWAYEYDKQNGRVTFDGFMKKRCEHEEKTGKKYPVEIPDCGKEIYNENRNDSVHIQDGDVVKSVKSKTASNEDDLKEKDLNDFWCKYIYNDAYENCMPYVWKLRISNKKYTELKGKLKEIPKEKLLKGHCEKLFVYVAEWFKWEYQLGSRNNAFTDLDMNNISGKEVWESLNKWQNFRYSGESNDIHLYSIYSLGGLPLNYIKNVNRNDRFSNAFESVFRQDEKEVVEDKFYSATEGLSGAFKQSLEDENGSWHHLIQAIQYNYKSLYSEDDEENELVINLCQLLENGKKHWLEDKFNVRYHVWKSLNNFYIHRTLRMRECGVDGYDEIPSDVISRNRIVQLWGINNPSYVFELQFKIGQKQLIHKFVPYRDTDYRSSIWQNEFELPDLTDEEQSSSVEISYVGQDGESRIPKINFPSKGYIEFRQEGRFEWKDKASTRTLSERAAVLFDTKKWKVCDTEMYKYQKGHYAWEEYSDEITLIGKVGQNNKTLYNTNERFWIKPNEKSIHPIVKQSCVKTDNYKVKLTKDGEYSEERKVYLLKHPVKFDVLKIFTDDSYESSVETKIIEYRLPSEKEYKEYTDGINDQGYMIFRVTAPNGQREEIHGYILPSEAMVTRHCDGGRIKYTHPKNEGFSNSYDANNENVVNNDYTDVVIGDEYKVVLDVVLPFRRRERFRDGVLDTLNSAIPIRFSDQYQVRVMDDNGVDRIAVDKNHRPRLMSKLKESILENKKDKIQIDDIVYCAYTSDIQYVDSIGFYVDSGNEVYGNNLHFKFLSLDDNALTDIELEEMEVGNGNRRTKYLVLNNIPPKCRGVVFQSLYDKDCKKIYPLRYYRPRYISSTDDKVKSDDKVLRKTKRLCAYVADYKKCIPEETFKHYDVACRCGCYFAALDRLLALTYTPSCNLINKCDVGVAIDCCDERLRCRQLCSVNERMAKFYVGYYEYCVQNDIIINYDELWRMSEELCYDWLSIPRSIWLKVIGEKDKEIVINLLKQRPKEFYKKLLENYWNLEWNKRQGLGGAYNFMKYILTAKGECPTSIPSSEDVNKEIDRLLR